MPTEYLYLLVISFAASAASTPLLCKMAIKLDITDHPSDRKVHAKPIPYLGGIAFFIAVSCSILYVFLFIPYMLDVQVSLTQLLVLYFVSMAFLILGIVDDALSVQPGTKLVVQAILSLILVSAGFGVNQITSPFGGVIPLGWLGWLISMVWILTIVNAINFIDGLDGLAAGIVFFAALANFGIALQPWQHFVCMISIMLMGATLGFLPYNFSPARIFMGDAGSLYLGSLLAGVSLISNTKGATVMSLSLPLVILSIPLLDTLLTVIRRGKRGFHLFKADREHIHHRLLRLGFTDRQAVLFLYGLCFLLSISALLAAKLPDQYTFLFILVFLAAIAWGMIAFSAMEERIVSNDDETGVNR